VQSIELNLDAYSSGAPIDDDRTLVVLKRVEGARP